MSENKKKNVLRKLYSDPYLGRSEIERRTQKRAFIILLVLSFITLGLGGWHIGSQLRQPFEPKINSNRSNTNAVNTTVTLAGLDELRSEDTDGDGVSDYDEFYIFKTSPYIVDSDSDGIPDNEEIAQGTDPNCPTGKNCARTIIGDDTNSAVNGIFQDIQPDQLTNTSSVDINNLSADDVRQILRDAGASEELLSQIPDDELYETYRQILEERNASDQNTNAATNAADQDYSAMTYEALQGLSASEIREFLVQSGVPEETLAQVDDSTLQTIFRESLQQNVQDSGLTNTNTTNTIQ